MFDTTSSLKNLQSNKFHSLYRRLLFLILALIVYRIGVHIPVPGINPEQLKELFSNQQNSILGMFNLFSGGALSRFTVFSLGIMPYISASIIMQLLIAIVPTLENLKKEGRSGEKKIAQYTRYGTLLFSSFQAFGIALICESQPDLVFEAGFIFRTNTVITLVTGTMFLMWLGEQITERGLGNGISIIIFSGICSGLPNTIGGLLNLVRTGAMSIIIASIIMLIVILVTFFVVFVECGQRRILVNYAKRQIGNKIYTSQASHLPLKLNTAGVIPPIFASSIILFPTMIINWLTSKDINNFFAIMIQKILIIISPGSPIYILMYAVTIIFFCFFYTTIALNSKETADNLKKSGAFIPGIRPGEQTARYLDKILIRLTLMGSMYMVMVCLLPEFLVLHWNVPFYFGGTALLIIVVVTMDFVAQIQSYVMQQQYDSLLKKANFKMGNLK